MADLATDDVQPHRLRTIPSFGGSHLFHEPNQRLPFFGASTPVT